MLLPLGMASIEIVRLMGRLLPGARPSSTRSTTDSNRAPCPARSCWCRWPSGWRAGSRGGCSPGIPSGGVERPALEIWTAILAFAPAVGWLGNPAWWRETLPRLAHYAMLNGDRRGALPDIRILYLGRIVRIQPPLA